MQFYEEDEDEYNHLKNIYLLNFKEFMKMPIVIKAIKTLVKNKVWFRT